MTAEEYRTWLTEHAAREGLIDPALLDQANRLLAPEAAAADLKARFPESFRPSVRGLTEAKYRVAKSEMLADVTRQQQRRAATEDLRRLGAVT